MLVVSILLLSQTLPGTPPATADTRHDLKMDLTLDAAFLAAADANRDGALSLAEFEAEMDRRLDAKFGTDPAFQTKFGPDQRAAMREKMLAPAFRGMDKNSDGLLTGDEVRAFAK